MVLQRFMKDAHCPQSICDGCLVPFLTPYKKEGFNVFLWWQNMMLSGFQVRRA